MAKPYTVVITNGSGSKEILNGDYAVSAEVTGYSNDSIDPKSLTVVEGTNSYALKIAATGTLTLHVTENGTDTGTPVVGATFIRCDASGTTYGNEVTTDSAGDAIFNNVPFDATNAPTIYFKQNASDGNHEFDSTLKDTTLTDSTKTIQITNALPISRTITLTDANYENLPISSGSITLS